MWKGKDWGFKNVCSIFPSTGGLCKIIAGLNGGSVVGLSDPWVPEKWKDLRLVAICLLLAPPRRPWLPSGQAPCLSKIGLSRTCPQDLWAFQKPSPAVLIPEALLCHEQKVHLGAEDLGLSLVLSLPFKRTLLRRFFSQGNSGDVTATRHLQTELFLRCFIGESVVGVREQSIGWSPCLSLPINIGDPDSKVINDKGQA